MSGNRRNIFFHPKKSLEKKAGGLGPPRWRRPTHTLTARQKHSYRRENSRQNYKVVSSCTPRCLKWKQLGWKFQTSDESIVQVSSLSHLRHTQSVWKKDPQKTLMLFFYFQGRLAPPPHTHTPHIHTHIRTRETIVVWNLFWFPIVSAHTTQIYLHIRRSGEKIKVCVCLKVAERHTKRGKKRYRERQRGAAVAGGKASTNLTVDRTRSQDDGCCPSCADLAARGPWFRFGLEFRTALRNAARTTSLCVCLCVMAFHWRNGRKNRMVVRTQVDDEYRKKRNDGGGWGEERGERRTPATFPRPSLFSFFFFRFLRLVFLFLSNSFSIFLLFFGVWQQQVFPSISIRPSAISSSRPMSI